MAEVVAMPATVVEDLVVRFDDAVVDGAPYGSGIARTPDRGSVALDHS
jgi:hypothetical protein